MQTSLEVLTHPSYNPYSQHPQNLQQSSDEVCPGLRLPFSIWSRSMLISRLVYGSTQFLYGPVSCINPRIIKLTYHEPSPSKRFRNGQLQSSSRRLASLSSPGHQDLTATASKNASGRKWQRGTLAMFLPNVTNATLSPLSTWL